MLWASARGRWPSTWSRSTGNWAWPTGPARCTAPAIRPGRASEPAAYLATLSRAEGNRTLRIGLQMWLLTCVNRLEGEVRPRPGNRAEAAWEADVLPFKYTRGGA